jgi:hypothetical protein
LRHSQNVRQPVVVEQGYLAMRGGAEGTVQEIQPHWPILLLL